MIHSPVVFGILAQLLGGGFMLPLYFFLFYTYSPIGNFKASDNRLTNVWNTSSTFPVMFLFSLTPIYLMYQSPKLETRQYWSFAWQMFPVWVEIGQQVILKIMPDTMKYNRIYAPKADVTPVRLTVWTFTVISAAAWIYTLVTSPFSMADIFVPTLHPKDEFIALTRYFLQMDWIAIFGSAFLWLVYAFGDLKTAGMVHQGWATILGLGALSFVCVGPGATFALGWLWREETLISKRHKKAVIWESLSEEDKKAAGAENVALDGNTKVRNGYANGATNGHAKKH